MHMFTITKQLEHLHVLKEQTLSEEKGLGWGGLHVYLIQCSQCEWRIIFFKKNEDKSQVSVADDLAVREAIYKS